MRLHPARILFVLAALALAATLSAAQEEPPDLPSMATSRVTGEFWFWNGCRYAMMDVMARVGRWGRPDYGHIYYRDEDPSGAVRYYRAAIDSVTIEPGRAIVSGQIMETNVPEWEFHGVQAWMSDSGRPGGRDDEFGAMFFDWPDHLPYAHAPVATPIIEGNLLVNP
ncbi:MAG TPA: hypothetical protein VFP98_05980 [Candidatus Polarisedimenticolia bacterium]|nr:hypothetical protein [Candidatus Polarisedimenticolia bacterium]